MKKIYIFILILSFTSACKISKYSVNHSINTEKKIWLKNEPPEVSFYWELNDENKLWSENLGAVNSLNEYRDTLELVLGSTVLESAIVKESAQDLDQSAFEGVTNGDKINSLLVQTNRIGKIRKINYLEAQILNYQLSRYPLFSHPTEFHAFITKNEKLNKIRVYIAASDTGWPPKPRMIRDELDKDVNKDWKLIRHLHNHFCKADNNYIGILAPSLADAHYFKMLKNEYNIDKALITNGFHTVEIESKDFVTFKSH